MIFDVARLAFDGFFKAFRRLDVLTQPEEGEAAGDVFFRLRLFPAVDVFDDGLVDGSVGNMLRDIVVDDLFGDEGGAAVGADARLFFVCSAFCTRTGSGVYNGSEKGAWGVCSGEAADAGYWASVRWRWGPGS